MLTNSTTFPAFFLVALLLADHMLMLNSFTLEHVTSALTVLLFPLPEQQDSMATTVAVSPSEYLQPSTASSQVSNKHLCLCFSLRVNDKRGLMGFLLGRCC